MKSIRAQPMEKLEMLNGTTTWIRADTRRNMDKIYDFLEKRFEGRFLGTGRLTFSYSQIAKATGICNMQVSFACYKLSFLENPVVRIHARRHTCKTGVKVYEGVELIRRLPAAIPEETADHPT